MPGTWALLLGVFALVVGPFSEIVNAQVTDINSEAFGLRNKVAKREVRCAEGLHRGGQFCCQPCPPGTRKAADCKSEGGEPECVFCKEAEEYTDKGHYSPKCRRCAFCDRGLGLEVERNCTRTQDTKCRCKPNFYCDTSVCEHCNSCTLCEHGIIEECTPTSNTKCKIKDSISNWWALCVLFTIPICFGVYMKWKNYKNKPSHPPQETETVPLNVSDADFSKYISRFAQEMTIHEVREFARKNDVPEAKIDDIKNDCLQDTAEQKVQLLHSWYQVNGKKNAYQTFIKSLEEAKLYAHSKKFQNIVQSDLSNNHENSNLTSESERQSLA